MSETSREPEYSVRSEDEKIYSNVYNELIEKGYDELHARILAESFSGCTDELRSKGV